MNFESKKELRIKNKKQKIAAYLKLIEEKSQEQNTRCSKRFIKKQEKLKLNKLIAPVIEENYSSKEVSITSDISTICNEKNITSLTRYAPISFEQFKVAKLNQQLSIPAPEISLIHSNKPRHTSNRAAAYKEFIIRNRSTNNTRKEPVKSPDNLSSPNKMAKCKSSLYNNKVKSASNREIIPTYKNKESIQSGTPTQETHEKPIISCDNLKSTHKVEHDIKKPKMSSFEQFVSAKRFNPKHRLKIAPVRKTTDSHFTENKIKKPKVSSFEQFILAKRSNPKHRLKIAPVRKVTDSYSKLLKVSLAELKEKVKQSRYYLKQEPQKFAVNAHSSCYKIVNPFNSPCNFDLKTVESYDALCVQDIKDLVLYAILNAHSRKKPTWCNAGNLNTISAVNMIVIDNVSLEDFCKYRSLFKESTRWFSQCDMLRLAVFDSFCSEFPLPVTGDCAGTLPTKIDLLLNPVQMINEGYPVPDYVEEKPDYQFTKESYTEVTNDSPMYAIDCEMCMTISEKSALTRVSIVDESYSVIYNTLVKPKDRITNYLTQYSGITASMMQGVTTTLKDVQKEISRILPSNAILVGQSLNSDLIALKLVHPYVIDTSVIYNTVGNRNIKTSLKNLTSMFLNESIQCGNEGHDSIEDSVYALKLVHLKLSKGIHFGDTLSGYDIGNPAVADTSTDGLFTRILKFNKAVSLIGELDQLNAYTKCDSKANVNQVYCNGAEEILEVTLYKMTVNHLTISHLVPELTLDLEIPKIDSFISSVYKNKKVNALVVVVFSGIKTSSKKLMGLVIPMV